MTNLIEIKKHIETGKVKLIADSVQSALNAGHDAESILNAMIASIEIVGKNFATGELYLPEMQNATKTLRKGVSVLWPYLSEKPPGTCVIGSVEGDLHDIGKNMVLIMIESVGFNMIDLGVNVQKEKFVEAVNKNENVVLVAASAFLPSNMPALKETVGLLKATYPDLPIIIGGSSVTQKYADEIGADGFAPNAVSSATIAKKLIDCKKYGIR